MGVLNGYRWAIVGMTVVAGLGMAACGGHGGKEIPAEMPPLAVPVQPAADVAWPSGLEVTAGLEPFRRAMPGTVLMGRVDQVLRREGDRVAAGTVLARVESRDVAARLAQAEAAVAAARAGEENARLMLERMERLHARQAVPQKALDDARAGYAAAEAQLRAAEEGVLAAQVYVGYAQVTSPFTGVVTQKNVEVGDLAAPGMPLFVVEDVSKMKVEAQVAESALAGLVVGGPVEVEVTALDGLVRTGTLAEILPAANPMSRTLTVRVVLDNADGALRSGLFARLRLAGEPTTAVAVPRRPSCSAGPWSASSSWTSRTSPASDG
jgi:RND family efflux transporter MFP subunit